MRTFWEMLQLAGFIVILTGIPVLLAGLIWIAWKGRDLD